VNVAALGNYGYRPKTASQTTQAAPSVGHGLERMPKPVRPMAKRGPQGVLPALRELLATGRPYTLQQLADELGVSRERIRQLQRDNGLKRIKPRRGI